MTFLCKTCGTQFPESEEPPAECPICSDDRQYVPDDGQQWVSYDDVRGKHQADIHEEQPQLTGIGMKPEFGIGQRALLVESPGGNVLWDCLPLSRRDGVVRRVARRSARNRDLAPALLHDDHS